MQGYSVRVNEVTTGVHNIVFSLFTDDGQYDISSANISKNKWHHITCVYGNNTQSIYLDGSNEKTRTTIFDASALNQDSSLIVGFNKVYVPQFDSSSDFLEITAQADDSGKNLDNVNTFAANVSNFTITFWIYDETTTNSNSSIKAASTSLMLSL